MSPDVQLLRFQVQGSAASPYRLTADGVGAAFRMFCSCPAGRMARRMCKHVAALLMGDVGALVAPSDDVDELARWAQGSELITTALHHRPAAVAPACAFDTPVAAGLDAAFASLVKAAEVAGWYVDASPTCIALHERTRTGRLRKHPTLRFEFLQGRRRPFDVSAPEGAARSFSRAERAGAHFAEVIQRFAPTPTGGL